MKSILRVVGLVALGACGGSTGGSGDAGPPDGSGCPDRDHDKLCDADEITAGTNPDVADSDNDGVLDGDEVAMGTNPLNPDTDGDGIPDGDELDLGTNPKVPDRGCASLDLGATLSQKPVDIIMMVDNSSSMGEEIKGVQDQINQNFAEILNDSGLDYQLILLSYYGDVDERADADPTHFCNTSQAGETVNLDPHECEICIGPPLAAGATCPPTAAGQRPGNGARFKHYTVTIDSHNSLDVILASYAAADVMGQSANEVMYNPWVREANGTTPWVSLFGGATPGWRTALRKGAQRVFLEVTDDEQTGTTTSTKFQMDLANLPSPPQLDGELPFGTLAEPNYVFHSILGLADNTPADKAYEPTDPLVAGTCTSGEAAGTRYQELSRATGGLRFPVCNPAGYGVIFNKIATKVVEGAEIECDFPVPPAPPGESLDFSRIFLVYIPGNGGTNQQIRRVANEGACEAGKFYTTGGGANTVIHLCPATCTPIQDDNGAEIKVNVACTEIIP